MGAEEQRKFVRLDTTVPVAYRVVSSTATARPTTTKNLSAGGICLFVNEPLSSGATLDIEIALPGRAAPLRLTGEVVWCETYELLGATDQVCNIQVGVKFVDIHPDDQDAIQRYMILRLPSSARSPSS